MAMHNPPHPGEFIRTVYLEPFGLSARQIAAKLNVAPSTIVRVLQGRSAVSPEMALRLSKTLGRSPESWLAMQSQHDLWLARQKVSLEGVEDIWDTITEVPQEGVLTAEQNAEIDRRLDAYHRNPEEGSPWGAVRERIRRK